MSNKLDIIRFNDDNHAERLWVDGKYIGDLSDISSIIEKLFYIIKDKSESLDGIKAVEVYVCDDFDDFDEDDEIVDNIWDWFNEVKEMTPEQMEKVHNKDWKGLNSLI